MVINKKKFNNSSVISKKKLNKILKSTTYKKTKKLADKEQERNPLLTKNKTKKVWPPVPKKYHKRILQKVWGKGKK